MARLAAIVNSPICREMSWFRRTCQRSCPLGWPTFLINHGDSFFLNSTSVEHAHDVDGELVVFGVLALGHGERARSRRDRGAARESAVVALGETAIARQEGVRRRARDPGDPIAAEAYGSMEVALRREIARDADDA